MPRKFLDEEKIANLLEELPSDYDEDTDEEVDHTTPSSTVQTIDMLLDDSATVTLVEDIESGETSEAYVIDIMSEPAGTSNVTSRNPSSNGECQRKWMKKPEPAVDVSFSPRPIGFVDFSSPLDAFLELFNEDIIEKVLYESNLKSVQNHKPAAITKDELKVFLGINIMMGYHCLPSIAHYWASARDLEVLPIKNAMSRERFQIILRNLHVNDNSKMDPRNKDKLYKIRPLLQHLNAVFADKRPLKEYLCIDESMILFKGRSSLKQYNPMKPIKRGYKLWCLADDDGYVYKTDVYTGKKEDAGRRSELGLGGDVVTSLLSNVKEPNHKVTFDNFFSSIPLLEDLQTKKILACGTIRANRKGLPKLIEDKKMKRGDFDYRSTPYGISVYKWMDSKPVHFISNYHGDTLTTVERKKYDGSRVTVQCPDVVKDYNEHMGGVDKHDAARQCYGSDRKSTKWWHRLFFGLLDMALVNAHILYNEEMANENISMFDFVRNVALGLMTYSKRDERGLLKRRKSNYSTPTSVRLSNVGVHLVEFTNNKNRCEVCSKGGVQSRVITRCSHCGVHLCCNSSRNCFNTYHTA